MEIIKDSPISTLEQSEQRYNLLYIYSPFCGTCHVARKMLEALEGTYNESLFYEMNAALYPDFMSYYQIESVPCLLITQSGDIIEKVYAFQSVPYLYEKINEYRNK